MRLIFCLLLSASCCIGCSVSHQPLSDPRDLVFDPTLIGTWRNEHGDNNAPADSIKGLARTYAEDRQAFPVTMTFKRVHTDD